MQRQISTIPVTERDLREWIRDLCKLFGWKFLFVWTSIHSPKGMLDLLLINEGQKRSSTRDKSELYLRN